MLRCGHTIRQDLRKPVIYKRSREGRALSTTCIKNKWEKELDTEITTEEWLNMCETQQTTTNLMTWGREFGWKNVTRYFTDTL